MLIRAFAAALLLGAVLLSPALRAQAPDAARVSAAKEMMQAAGAIKQFDEVMPLIADQMSQSFKQLAPDKTQEITEVFRQLVPRFLEKKEELLDEIAALYAAELSLEELNAIVAFYKSPTGVKFAAVQPGIMRQSMVVGQRWGKRIGIELDAEVRRELKKRGVDL